MGPELWTPNIRSITIRGGFRRRCIRSEGNTSPNAGARITLEASEIGDPDDLKGSKEEYLGGGVGG